MAEFYKQTTAEALAELKSSKETGLTTSEATARLAQYGPNALPAGEGTNILELLLDQAEAGLYRNFFRRNPPPN